MLPRSAADPLQLGNGDTGHDGSLANGGISSNGALEYDLAGSQTAASPSAAAVS